MCKVASCSCRRAGPEDRNEGRLEIVARNCNSRQSMDPDVPEGDDKISCVAYHWVSVDGQTRKME